MVQSNRCQPNGLRIVDRSDNVLEMPTENPAVVGRERGVVDRRAVRDNDKDLASFVAIAQTTCGPSNGFTVHVLLEQFVVCQIANRPWRTSIPIIRRAIHNVQEIAQTTRVGGPARPYPLLT